MGIYNGVFKEIITLAQEYKDSTGLTPTKLYVGRIQVRSIREWCYSVGYIDEGCEVFVEGLSRPVIAGLAIYVVNAEDHMRCCM